MPAENRRGDCCMHRDYVEFTKKMKKEYTILAPDMLPIHMRLLSGIFTQYGYRVHILRYTGKKVLDTGLKYVHNDMCYPAICTLGQLLYGITCGDYDPKKTALMHFQTGRLPRLELPEAFAQIVAQHGDGACPGHLN